MNNERIAFAVTLFRDKDAAEPHQQLGLPLMHVATARQLAFDWARERDGSFLRISADFDHLEEWTRTDGWWRPTLVPPLEQTSVKASR